MQKITSTSGLREAIVQLELKQKSQEIALKEQFFLTYESFKSVNLIKRLLIEMATSPGLISGLIKTVIELKDRRPYKQQAEAPQSTVFKQIMSVAIKFGLTDLVIQHADDIKSFGHYLINRIFRKKEKESKDKAEE